MLRSWEERSEKLGRRCFAWSLSRAATRPKSVCRQGKLKEIATVVGRRLEQRRDRVAAVSPVGWGGCEGQ